MADLSKNKSRVGTQDRPVYRRDGVLPKKQGPDSPARRASIDVRAGRRGDGGAQAVMQLARQVNGAFQDYQQYDQQKYIYDEQQNAFKAVTDENLGQMDEGLFAESAAYKEAYSLSKVNKEMAEAEPMLRENLQKYINGYQGVDLAAGIDELEKMTEGNLQVLLSDEDGNLRDLGSARAFATASSRISTMQQKLRADGITALRGRIAENGKELELERGLAEVRNGGVLDIPGMIQRGQTYGLSEDDMIDGVVDMLTVLDRENPAMAAKYAAQLMGIKSDVKSVRSPSTGIVKEVLAPTGKLPVSGRITSQIGDGRNHNGVDIDGKIGDPVEAPAGGRVIEVGFNNRAGNFIRVEHANGVESTYSHLDSALVAEGDVIRPGQRFATVGNTGNVKKGPNGDGSHLHWVVRENGQMKNPLEFQFPEYEAEAPVIEVAQAASETETAPLMVLPAGFRLSPQQLDKLSSLRESSEERARVLANRAQDEQYKATNETLYQSALGGNFPTDAQLKELVERGALSSDAAFSWRNMRQAEINRQQAAADRLEARAEREANKQADVWAAQIAMEWNMGEGPTTESEFNSFIRKNMGKLGGGTNTLQNWNVLRTAYQRFQSLTTGNPEYKQYNDLLKNDFKPSTASGVAGALGDNNGSKQTQIMALSDYRRYVVSEGLSPGDAYARVLKENGKSRQVLANRVSSGDDGQLAALEARRRAAGITD